MSLSMGGNVKSITLMNRNGTVAGTLHISTSANKKSGETKKRLNYNFKSISSMILRAKTTGNASQAVIKARGKLADLRRKMHTGKYDDKELEDAITHAAKMVRIAKKRVNHLKEEEDADKKGTDILSEEEEQAQEESEAENFLADPNLGSEEKEKRIKQCMSELQDQMRELLKEIDRDSWMEELSGEIIADTKDMSPEERENLRRRHRSAELRDIIRADMEYLKAKFQRLEDEKRNTDNGSCGFSSSGSESITGVTLELGGVQMPAAAPEMPVPSEGASVDAAL